MNLAEALEATPVSSLNLSRYVEVDADESVRDVVGSMSVERVPCACVVDDGSLIGIFTQRDALQRVIGHPVIWDRPITDEMSRSVRTMSNGGSVADGLAIMNEWWVRNVPVLDTYNRLSGNLSYTVVMITIANILRARLGETSEERAIHQTLAFVDFTGLNMSHPVTVRPDDTVDIAAHHMRARSIGSLLVTDARGQLVGVLSEFDLLTHIGCDEADLSRFKVSDLMTENPVALSARSSIAVGIGEMAQAGFSHVPLLGESNRPVGVVSFRDVAEYVELNIETLG